MYLLNISHHLTFFLIIEDKHVIYSFEGVVTILSHICLVLKFTNLPPVVAVLGRNSSTIYIPAKLLCLNELDPFVKHQLPLIASFKFPKWHQAIKEMKRFLTHKAYGNVRNLVNKFDSSYRFRDKPFAVV